MSQYGFLFFANSKIPRVNGDPLGALTSLFQHRTCFRAFKTMVDKFRRSKTFWGRQRINLSSSGSSFLSSVVVKSVSYKKKKKKKVEILNFGSKKMYFRKGKLKQTATNTSKELCQIYTSRLSNPWRHHRN